MKNSEKGYNLLLEEMKVLEKIKDKKMFFGKKEAIKGLKKDTLKRIFLTKDCSEEMKEEITSLSELHKGKIEVIQLENTKEELKETTKKAFNSCIISIIK